MRNLRGRVSLLGSLLLPAIATAQGYVALEIDGVAGVDYVGGQAVAAAGDVDGDGVTDVIVGAPSVLQGQAKIFSGATGAQLQVFTGNALNDLFGWAVGGTGDLDGDGNDDVIVGAIHASPGGVSVAGQATVYSGATGAVLWTRNGALAGDFLGWSFARLGDVDSDGVDDTAVGVQLGDNGAAYDAGRVEVLSGATGLPILVLTGAAIADHFGASIALAGDVSGDGIPDLLVGAPEANPGGLADAGTATLYSLANGSVLLQFSGAAAGDHLGTSVAGVGDLDADGVPDLLLGAPQSTVAATGYARAYSGATAGLLFTVGGVGVFEDFGASVCGVGDLNGDVVPDFLVGAPDAGPGVGGGRVRALSGATGGILYDALGTVNDGALGTALAGLPDLDGDGVPDFVAGEPGIFQSAGLARVRSGANGAPVFTFLGQYLGDQFGRAAASVGDVDGDGRDDLVVGAPNADAGGLADSGRATLHSSAGGGVLVTVDGPSESALLGGSVAGLGDMDGDGVPDFAVGSPGEAQATGSVRVVSSASGAILLNLSGIGPTDQFGSCVAGTGDLNGDGVPDLVVGAPMPIGSGFGYARAYSGATGAILATYPSPGTGVQMGSSVAGLGDGNGDGVPDVAVGATEPGGFPFFPPGEGFVRVFSGATGGMLVQIDGTVLNERFGASLAPAGDLDGDGLGDLVAGAPGLAVPGFPGVGAIGAFSGATGTPIFILLGQAANEGFGASVAGGRDLDGDGVPEFVVGAPGLVSATTVGVARTFSGATGDLLLSIASSPPGDGLGSAVGVVGDASGDGVPDLLLPSPLADPGGRVDAGRVRVISPVGLPAGASPYGTGCGGSGGFVPILSTFGGSPAPGNASFGISIARVLPGAPAILLLGSLPDPVGVPILGCNLHLAGTVLSFPPTFALGGAGGGPGDGYRLLRLGVPPDPSLSGFQVHLQWALADGGSANGLFAASTALTLAIP